jgi:hypothetical protein
VFATLETEPPASDAQSAAREYCRWLAEGPHPDRLRDDGSELLAVLRSREEFLISDWPDLKLKAAIADLRHAGFTIDLVRCGVIVLHSLGKGQRRVLARDPRPGWWVEHPDGREPAEEFLASYRSGPGVRSSRAASAVRPAASIVASSHCRCG